MLVSVHIITTIRMLLIFGQEAVLGGNRASLRGPLLHWLRLLGFRVQGLGLRVEGLWFL